MLLTTFAGTPIGTAIGSAIGTAVAATEIAFGAVDSIACEQRGKDTDRM